MNKNQIINKVIGLILVIGSFIMMIAYLLVDWDVCSINLLELSANFWLLPMWTGIVIYQYRPDLSKTAKILSWAAIALFCISLLMIILGRGTWIHTAGKIAIITNGLLTLLAWWKINKENQSLDDEKDEDTEDDKN